MQKKKRGRLQLTKDASVRKMEGGRKMEAKMVRQEGRTEAADFSGGICCVCSRSNAVPVYLSAAAKVTAVSPSQQLREGGVPEASTRPSAFQMPPVAGISPSGISAIGFIVRRYDITVVRQRYVTYLTPIECAWAQNISSTRAKDSTEPSKGLLDESISVHKHYERGNAAVLIKLPVVEKLKVCIFLEQESMDRWKRGANELDGPALIIGRRCVRRRCWGKDRTRVEQEIWIRYSTPRRVVIRMITDNDELKNGRLQNNVCTTSFYPFIEIIIIYPYWGSAGLRKQLVAGIAGGVRVENPVSQFAKPTIMCYDRKNPHGHRHLSPRNIARMPHYVLQYAFLFCQGCPLRVTTGGYWGLARERRRAKRGKQGNGEWVVSGNQAIPQRASSALRELTVQGPGTITYPPQHEFLQNGVTFDGVSLVAVNTRFTAYAAIP
ncbi:hypothetical protein FPQ18DRAFT_380941 [Pyronema domesticum]|nr:hypothetical protein FPQ18DRAFT_380941 [Pyronema domesticum]